MLAHCARLPWKTKDEPSAKILPDGWQSTPGLLGAGELRHLVIIRPAMLTDGECRGDAGPKDGKPPYRAKRDGEVSGVYTVSRKDVAHFIVCDLLPNWNGWEVSAVVVAN